VCRKSDVVRRLKPKELLSKVDSDDGENYEAKETQEKPDCGLSSRFVSSGIEGCVREKKSTE
jgi:hypothetical protein